MAALGNSEKEKQQAPWYVAFPASSVDSQSNIQVHHLYTHIQRDQHVYPENIWDTDLDLIANPGIGGDCMYVGPKHSIFGLPRFTPPLADTSGTDLPPCGVPLGARFDPNISGGEKP
ncbi:hypothetical protein BDK51DRAFT_41088 [Blyttiomyces helicus]|uniref:Uncharacterized protein n=1 Tax=Blyttiomyces helicus TaxID=388810 RepID=A0A4P9WLB7_9FUNG|nr:hypothetical protein BDK51DRAFT_41088 [Blyttiomyces helicus]|eukprot:RKO93839.1 hypothetical protein BDK51DRAFT_41088 [Blyttiomyces helicus]